MTNRIGVIVLLLICLGLGVGIMVVKRGASEQRSVDVKQIETLSNQWSKASTDLDEQKKVAVMLEKDLEAKKVDYEKSLTTLTTLTNHVAQVTSNLVKVEANLRVAEEKIKEDNIKIADLESQNDAADRKAAKLSSDITNLSTQIAETQRKLATAEGNQAFLEKQLKDLVAEKAERERQFNDINVLRAQISKLKEEANVARRLEWSRQGVFANTEQKGAQKLMQGISASTPKSTRGNYDLNVEVSADGSVRVIPATNNAAQPNQPPAR